MSFFDPKIEVEVEMDQKKLQQLNFWEVFLSKERSLFNRYLFAVAISSISLCLVLFFQQIEKGTPFSSFAVLSVILSAIYGGKGPAFVDTMISSIGIDYFFSRPYFEVFDSVSSVTRVIVYMALGYLIANLVESLKDSFLIVRAQKHEVETEKKARENVLGVVSHDLRSPLASIIMNAEILIRGINSGKLPASAPKLLSNIKSSGNRMNRLIEDLLDAVKVEAGQFKVDLKKNEISEIVNSSVEEAHATARLKNITINTDFAPGHHFVNCDQSRLIQVMSNMLGNAIKFSPNDSEVDVRITSCADWVSVSVKDQGPGISREDLSHLFDRYWQAKSTAHKGTGLGLFISKSIIDQHEGRIEVSSNLGEGTLFKIHLPKLISEIIESEATASH